MNNLTYFLLSSGLCFGLLLLPFRLFLSRLTHFVWNRYYLMGILALSTALPLFWMNSGFPLSQAPLPVKPIATAPVPPEPVQPPQLSPAGESLADSPVLTAQAPQDPPQVAVHPTFFSWSAVWPWLQTGLLCAYFLGLLIGMIRLGRSIGSVLKLARQSPQEMAQGMTLVFPPELKESFSFFHYLFLSPSDRQSPERTVIEEHEQVHIRELHSLDVLLTELACKLWWFLPWMAYFRNSVKENHEYLADASVASSAGVATYSKLVLSRTCQSPSPLPVHFFAQSKTTKRIIMLTQKPSRKWSRMAYFGLLPAALLALSLMAFMPVPSPIHLIRETPTSAPRENSLNFAGEAFPSNATLSAGLQSSIERLARRPEGCRKLYLRAAFQKNKLGKLIRAEGLPIDFLYLAMAESSLDPSANSSMGACGLWQFIPSTAKSYGMVIQDERDDRRDMNISTKSAAEYLKKYKAEFGSWTAAAIAFNRGPAPLRKLDAGKQPIALYQLDHERGYLYRVLAMKTLAEHPETFGLEHEPALASPIATHDLERVSSTFGPRKSPFDQAVKNHDGIDLVAPAGTEIRAIADGVVSIAEDTQKKRGKRVNIDHGAPLSSAYNHMQSISVKPGQKVKQGQVIGTVGNTGQSSGPHLHLELHENGIPVDPELYLNL